MRSTIRRLLEAGKIVAGPAGRLSGAPVDETVRGTVQRHKDGFGFVVPEAGGDDLFVAPRDLGDTPTGEVVEARITRRGRGGRLQGVIVERHGVPEARWLGVARRRGSGFEVQSFDSSIGAPVRLGARAKVSQGDVVEVIVGGKASARISEIVGRLGDPQTEVEVTIRKHRLRRVFPDETLAAADALPSRVRFRDKQRRKRFDDPSPVTIDGETAKDFDDAIAVSRRKKGGYRLHVHIADVSHFVQPDDAVDQEARLRGTSVYFPGMVIPMLPPRLSDDLCSLRPGVDRLVQTAILDFDGEGRPAGVSFADGVIRSAARLTYRQVGEMLDGDPSVHGIPGKVVPMLHVAEELRTLLSARRQDRGGIDMDLPEPQLLMDVEGVVTGIQIEPRNRAHLMIEEFMIAANEGVARWLRGQQRDCVYRVHSEPDIAKLEALAGFARSLGYEVPDADKLDGFAIGRLLERAEGTPDIKVLSQMVLRSMKQARYGLAPDGHFGLGAADYCHFTSPIRRYPDLIVHRQVRAARARKTAMEDVDLEALAARLTVTERTAEAAERELLAWKKLALVVGREGDEFDGVVTGVARFGLFVQLVENQVDGLVHVEGLGGEHFGFDEARQELLGSRSGRSYRLGSRLRVRLERVDRVLRRVDLAVLNPTPGGGERHPGKRRARSGGEGRRPGTRRKRQRS